MLRWLASPPVTSRSEPERLGDIATAAVANEGSDRGHQSKASSVCGAVCIFAFWCWETQKSVGVDRPGSEVQSVVCEGLMGGVSVLSSQAFLGSSFQTRTLG